MSLCLGAWMNAKTIAALILLLGSVGIIYSAYYFGSKHGQQKVQSLWDDQKEADRKATDKLKAEYAQTEALLRAENAKVTHELSQANKKYEVELTQLRSDYDKRLRSSNERAQVYQRQAESGAAECRNLAVHAAKLDRNLEEGRSLVRELRATVGQRDDTIRALSQQLLNDRKLFSVSGE